MDKLKTFFYCQTIACMCCSFGFTADIDTTEEISAAAIIQVDSSLCTKEVLMTFFPQPITKAVLLKHKVPEDKAEVISKELVKKSEAVTKSVEEKASKMETNPFTDLSQRDAAVKLFRETLFEVFSSVIKENQIEMDSNEIQALLDDMQEVKGRLFVECIKKEQTSEKK